MYHLLRISKYDYFNLILLIGLWLIWGYNYVAIKEALSSSSPIIFSVLRTFIGVAVLGLMLHKTIKWPNTFREYFILGILNTTVFVLCTSFSLKYNSAGRAAVLSFTMPFWSLLLGKLLLKEPISIIQVLAIIFCFIGVCILCGFPHNLLGDIFALLSGISLAASTIYTRYLFKYKIVNNFQNLLFWQMLCGGLTQLLFLALEEWQLIIEKKFVFNLLYSAIPANAFAWAIWFYLLQRVSAGVAGMNILAVPMFTLLLTIHKDKLFFSLSNFLGTAFICLGIIMICFLNAKKVGKE